MKTYKYTDRWYICTGKIGERNLFGAGVTHYEAIKNALNEYINWSK